MTGRHYFCKKNNKGALIGLHVSKAASKSRKKKKNEKSSDTQNREKARKMIVEMFDKGLSEEDILQILLKDPIVNEFEYFSQNGIDIKNIFMSWIKSEKNKKPIKKKITERE